MNSAGQTTPERSDKPSRVGDAPSGLVTVLLPLVAAGFIRLLRSTMRIDHVGREHLEKLESENRNFILTFWHAHLLLMPYSVVGHRVAALISRHKDGEYIARTMRYFGHDAIRGSTTRGGAIALRGAVKRLKSGWDVGFTPDGPRGPRLRVQPGVILAARLSGAPILPVAFAAAPAWRMNSWDRFLVPRPFSRGTFRYGSPMNVPRDADEDVTEQHRLRLERDLLHLSGPDDAAPGSPGGGV